MAAVSGALALIFLGLSGPALMAEPAVEVRRAVAMTVRLGEPIPNTDAARETLAVGAPGLDEGSGEEEAWEGEEADPSEGGDGIPVANGNDAGALKRFVLTLETGAVYDDNIFLQERDRQADLLWRVGAEGRLNLGDAKNRYDTHVIVRYRPEAFFFLENSDENSLDHEAEIRLRHRWARLAVDGAADYQRTSGSTVELGDRVERDVISASGGLSYDVGAKTSVATALRWDATAYREGGYADSSEWAHEGFVDYQATEKFRFGLGGGYGRLDVDDGSEPQEFQRALARFHHEATGSLVVKGRVGLEFRQTEVGRSTTPVFGVDAVHDLTAKSQIRLQAVQEVAASGSLQGQNYTRTGLSMGLSHRLNDRLAVSLDGGWEQFDYEPASRAAESRVDRTDDAVFARPGFSYSLGDRWKAEAWYQWRSNDSSIPGQTWEANQAGLMLSYTF